MGNYYQLEIDFVRRTLDLIEQYEQLKSQFPFEQQFNHTPVEQLFIGTYCFTKTKKHCHTSQRQELLSLKPLVNGE